jgi:hypothetical protein
MTDASFYGSAYTQAESNGQHVSGITVPQKGSMQPDLSTKAAQRRHYNAIRARLMVTRPKHALNHDGITPVAESTGGVEKVPLTVKLIQSVVAEHFGLSVGDLLSRGLEAVVAPRQIAMCLAFRHTKKSASKLSILFGMDRTAISKAVKRIESMRHDDPQLASDLAAIEARLNDLA